MNYEVDYELDRIQRERKALDEREKKLLEKKARGLKEYTVSIERLFVYFIEAENEEEALLIYEDQQDDLPCEIHTFELPIVEER